MLPVPVTLFVPSTLLLQGLFFLLCVNASGARDAFRAVNASASRACGPNAATYANDRDALCRVGDAPGALNPSDGDRRPWTWRLAWQRSFKA